MAFSRGKYEKFSEPLSSLGLRLEPRSAGTRIYHQFVVSNLGVTHASQKPRIESHADAPLGRKVVAAAGLIALLLGIAVLPQSWAHDAFAPLAIMLGLFWIPVGDAGAYSFEFLICGR